MAGSVKSGVGSVGRAVRGFTLVEALIAATIFFASIGIVSEAYRASLAASRRAEVTAKLLTPLPIIVSQIADRLRDEHGDEWAGNGALLGVSYRASAKVIKKAAPPRQFDLDSGAKIQYAARFKVYEVLIDLSLLGQSRQFKYEELAWEPIENAP